MKEDYRSTPERVSDEQEQRLKEDNPLPKDFPKPTEKCGELFPQPPDPQAWEERLLNNFCFDKVDGNIMADMIIFIRSLLAQDRQRLREAIEGLRKEIPTGLDAMDLDPEDWGKLGGFNAAIDDIKRLLEEEKR